MDKLTSERRAQILSMMVEIEGEQEIFQIL
jgi:hypothetical protein